MKISEERLRKYVRKIDHILTCISYIDEWLREITPNDFLHDIKTKLAVYKAFQEIVDATMDICAMLCKDMGIPPSDDYTNIEKLYEKKIINTSLKDALFRSNGLRNRLIHHYNKLDDTIAYESITELIPKILEFVRVVEKWIYSK